MGGYGGTGELRHGNRIVIDREIVRITSLSPTLTISTSRSLGAKLFVLCNRKDRTCAHARVTREKEKEGKKNFFGAWRFKFKRISNRSTLNLIIVRICVCVLSVYRFKMEVELVKVSKCKRIWNFIDFVEVDCVSFDDKIIRMQFIDLEWIIYRRVSMVKMMKMEFIDLEWIFIISKLELENFVKKNIIRANLKLIHSFEVNYVNYRFIDSGLL